LRATTFFRRTLSATAVDKHEKETMMIKRRLCLLVVFSLTLAACAVTVKVASLTDPDYRDMKFKRVLVFGNFANLQIMEMMESTTVERLKEKGIYAIENYKLFPPIRQYSNEDKRQVIIKEKLDCYLVIAGKSYDSGTVYIPSISTTNVSANASANQGRGTATTVTSDSHEQEVVTSVQTEVQLYDLQNARLAWKGDVDSQIPYYGSEPMAEPDQVFKSTCGGIVDQLVKDGLVSETTNK
jgi:hypothetical protein